MLAHSQKSQNDVWVEVARFEGANSPNSRNVPQQVKLLVLEEPFVTFAEFLQVKHKIPFPSTSGLCARAGHRLEAYFSSPRQAGGKHVTRCDTRSKVSRPQSRGILGNPPNYQNSIAFIAFIAFKARNYARRVWRMGGSFGQKEYLLSLFSGLIWAFGRPDLAKAQGHPFCCIR